MKLKYKKLLLATLATATFCQLPTIAYAEYQRPSGSSNNEVIINNGNYTINGENYTYSAYLQDTYGILYSAWTDSGNVTNNTFTFNSGSLINASSIMAALATNGNASGNTLNLYGGTFLDTSLFLGANATGTASNNVVNIEQGITFPTSSFAIHAAYAATVTNNEVNINGDINSKDSQVTGGNATDTASSNVVNVDSGTLNLSHILGAFAPNSVSENKVNINGGSITTSNGIKGGYIFSDDSTTGNAENNSVTINDGTINATDGNGFIMGGDAMNTASGNKVNINGGTINVGIIGGKINSEYGTAKSNEVNITDGTVNPNETGSGIIGGVGSYSAGNKVNISGGNVTANFISGATGDTADDNAVTITDGILTITQNIVGGEGTTSASGNKINIEGGEFSADIIGGTSDSGSVTNNTINIDNSPDLASANLYGGFTNSGTISGNTLNIYTKGLTAKNIYNFDIINFYLPESTVSGDTILKLASTSTDISGAKVSAGVNGNANLNNGDTITLLTNAGTITDSGTTYGKLTEGISLDYDLTVSKSGDNSIIATIGTTTTTEDGGDDENGDDKGDDSEGGGTDESGDDKGDDSEGGTDESGDDKGDDSEGDGTDENGDDKGDDSEGGEKATGSASNNVVTVTSTNYTINGTTTNFDGSASYVYGGVSNSTDVEENAVYGGYETSGDSSNNTVNINSGTISNIIYGGYSENGNATNNTVNLYGGTDLANIYGGYAPNGSTSGNILNVYNKNISAQNLYNFDKMNFYISSDAVNGDTMLTLTNSEGTDLSNVSINAGVMAGNSNLVIGDKINLLTNENGLTTNSATTYGILTEGVSLNYGMDIGLSGNSVVANITKSPNSLNPQTEILPVSSELPAFGTVETSMNTRNFLDNPITYIEEITENETNDESGSVNDVTNVQIMEPKGWDIFANMGGGSLRMKGSDGSHVDMTTQSINLGFARSLENTSGRFTIAPIIDYSRSNYDSYLETGVHGSGKTRYVAGGLIARRMLRNGFYYETSVRVGKVKTDFSSDNLASSGLYSGQNVTYNTSATTFAGHLKLGKAFRLNKNNFLDVYGIYYHTRQNAMDADLSSGEHYQFSSANAGRLRLGYKLTTRTSKISQIYTGLAFQYERSSGITATYKNYSTAGASDNGFSGMLEVGWILKPIKALPWAVDINTTGWIGHQRGITAMAKIQKAF